MNYLAARVRGGAMNTDSPVQAQEAENTFYIYSKRTHSISVVREHILYLYTNSPVQAQEARKPIVVHREPILYL